MDGEAPQNVVTNSTENAALFRNFSPLWKNVSTRWKKKNATSTAAFANRMFWKIPWKCKLCLSEERLWKKNSNS